MSKSNDKRQRQLRTTSTIHTVTDTRKMSGDGDRFSLKKLKQVQTYTKYPETGKMFPDNFTEEDNPYYRDGNLE